MYLRRYCIDNRYLLVFLVIVALGCSTTTPVVYHDVFLDDPYAFKWDEDDRGRVWLDTDSFANVKNMLESDRPALNLYRENVTYHKVVEFFARVAGSKEIALPILYHADRNDLPLTLVFSLVWVESRFSPRAVNQNPASIDRGLFQLNSLSFRHLSVEDFFDPEISAYHGTNYLRGTFDQSTDEEMAVAIYNAGRRRVIAGQTPASTLVYVDRIMRYRNDLDRDFEKFIRAHYPAPTV